MRILYVGTFRFPDGDAAASRVLSNSRIFRELGHEVTILSFGGRYRKEDKTVGGFAYDGLKYVITNDMDTHSIKERLLRYTYPYTNCKKWMVENINTYDFVISYDPIYVFNKWLIAFCRKYDKKMACDIAEWYAPNEMPGGAFSPIYWCSEWNMKHTHKLIRNKILISSYLADLYTESNNIILPPLIDMNDEKWNKDFPIKDERIIQHKGIRILYAGTPGKKDLLGNLIQAIISLLRNAINDIQMIVIGVSERQALEYVNNHYDIDKYRNNLVFLGRIPQDTVPAYYRLCDFSAIIREPTRKNMAGFPTKMAESMAAGCPVILTKTSDLEFYANDGENAIYVADTSPDSIKSALEKARLLDFATLKSMRMNSYNVAKTKFQYSKYIQELKKWIDNLQ